MNASVGNRSAALNSAQTLWIELTRITLPPHARQHAADDITSLAEDMRRNGQLQEIVVALLPNTDESASEGSARGYVVLAGVGRTLAARKLGWENIRAHVREGLSEFDKLHITFSENEERDSASPIYQGRVLRQMLDVEGINQVELSNRIGKDKTLVSRYLSLTDLAPEVQEKLHACNFSLRRILEIIRLKSAEDQLRLAEECQRTDLSGRALRQRVDRMISDKRDANQGKSNNGKQALSMEDPLAETWKGIKSLGFAKSSAWHASYPSFHHWVIGYQAGPGDPRESLGLFFENLGKAVRTMQNAVPPVLADQQEMQAKMEAMANMPIRLPKNQAEHLELEAAARKSVWDFYAWLYGRDNPLIEDAKSLSWKDMGSADPLEGSRQILETIKILKNGPAVGLNA